MLGLVKNLQTALGQHIAALDWMSDATKAKAQEKLAAFTVKMRLPGQMEGLFDAGDRPFEELFREHRECQPLVYGRQYFEARQACR